MEEGSAGKADEIDMVYVNKYPWTNLLLIGNGYKITLCKKKSWTVSIKT